MKLRLLLISVSGLRQENLLAVLHSIPGSPEILCADSVQEAANGSGPSTANLVILDHKLNNAQTNADMKWLRQAYPDARIVQLAAHPREIYAFEDVRPDAVLCDGFSYTELMHEIRKAVFPLRSGSLYRKMNSKQP